MAARLKSSVLRREERGMGNISMGRLIGAGMFGGLAFMLMRVLGIGALMIPGGLTVFILALVFTQLRHGIPLYLHWLITLRARWLMHSLEHPQRWTARAAHFLDLHPEALTLNSAQLSAHAIIEEAGTLDDWEIIPDSAHPLGFEVVTDTLNLELHD